MKICFLSLPSYPTLMGLNLGYAGGAEVEQVALGRELSSRGYDVCFITYALDKSTRFSKGIEIIQTYPREYSDKLSFVQKYASVFSALRKANADIYFHESGAVGVLPFFGLFNNIKVVYRVPSDTTVLLESLSGPLPFSSSLIQRLEFERANAVFVQNRFQKDVLEQRFGVKSFLVKNGLFLPTACEKKPEPPIVLWVGSISDIKRPELFLQLAKALPNTHFEMVGGRGAPTTLFDKIASAASHVPNLKFNGFVRYDKVSDFYNRASILVNTSIREGLPNTFIQAWANFVPTISMNVDPDNVIKDNSLGFVSGDFQTIVSDVNKLLTDELMRKVFARNSRRYVEVVHDIKKVAENYITIFNGLMR